jgi:hypothetical protein
MGETAAGFRHLAEELVRQGRYAEAADAYRREAAIYRKNGDSNGAKVEEMKADRWSSELRLFAHLPDWRPAQARTRLAKYEPPYGCYIGAFLDRDERLGRPFFANDQSFQSPEVFGQMTGKKHASVFCYLSYGRAFPSEWVQWLKRQGVAPHIAWEPNQGLDMVEDDAYLRSFARAAAAARCPIFLRFASEMNGDWTAYSGNPVRYKAKWGTVYSVMASVAPNVAMVWCVNSIPEKNIEAFYPGDGYVDWVGINFYTVPFYDNDPRRVGLYDNPADQLKYVYRLYGARKPIMVCEFGASHLSRADGKDRSPWAGRQIHQLYAALPRLYPRVKLIDIFDNDNLTYAMPGRQLNNYSVTETQDVLRSYAAAVAPDYFLSDVGEGEAARRPTPVVPIGEGIAVRRGILRVSSWARCYADRFTVTYELDGRRVAAVSEPGPREADLDLREPGVRQLTAILTDDRQQVAARAQARITVS